jgi:hypothetical protein
VFPERIASQTLALTPDVFLPLLSNLTLNVSRTIERTLRPIVLARLTRLRRRLMRRQRAIGCRTIPVRYHTADRRD